WSFFMSDSARNTELGVSVMPTARFSRAKNPLSCATHIGTGAPPGNRMTRSGVTLLQWRSVHDVGAIDRFDAHLHRCASAGEGQWNGGSCGPEPPHLPKEIREVANLVRCHSFDLVTELDPRAIRRSAPRQPTHD